MTTAAALIAATARLIGKDATASDRFGIAVSGGPDSMALLLLAHAAFPGRIEAATVDHRARPEAAEWAAWVKNQCTRRGIAHETLTLAEPVTGSFQARARAARYAVLEIWRSKRQIDWIMTAHHADDQAETLVMRLNRSSGLAGLAGVRPRNGRILRPLLGTARDILAQTLVAAGVQPIDDPSNHDSGFDRVRVRQQLARNTLLDPVAISASAAHLAEAEVAMQWITEHFATHRLSGDTDITLDSDGLPDELVRRLVVVALNKIGGIANPPRGDTIDTVIDQLRQRRKAMIGEIVVSPDRDQPARWHFAPAPPRRVAP